MFAHTHVFCCLVNACRDADVLCAKVYYGGVDSAAMTAAQWEGTVSGRVHNNFQCTTIVEVREGAAPALDVHACHGCPHSFTDSFAAALIFPA